MSDETDVNVNGNRELEKYSEQQVLKIKIASYQRKTLGIDGNSWMYDSHAETGCGIEEDQVFGCCAFRAEKLTENGIDLVFVFDGEKFPLNEKAIGRDEETQRVSDSQTVLKITLEMIKRFIGFLQERYSEGGGCDV